MIRFPAVLVMGDSELLFSHFLSEIYRVPEVFGRLRSETYEAQWQESEFPAFAMWFPHMSVDTLSVRFGKCSLTLYAGLERWIENVDANVGQEKDTVVVFQCAEKNRHDGLALQVGLVSHS